MMFVTLCYSDLLSDLWFTGPPMRDDWSCDSAPPPFRDFYVFFQMMRQKVVKVVRKRSVTAGLSHYAIYAAKFLTVIFFLVRGPTISFYLVKIL